MTVYSELYLKVFHFNEYYGKYSKIADINQVSTYRIHLLVDGLFSEEHFMAL